MSMSKEATEQMKHRKVKEPPPGIEAPKSFPPLDQLEWLRLLQNGIPYLCKIIKNRNEPTADELEDTLYENLSIDLDGIKEIFKTLTDDQRDIVMHVYYLYKNNKKYINQNGFGEISEDNPKIILQGPAGTGKSTIINLIEKLITWEENKTSDSPDKIKVLKCAFTGKAATNIDGVTLNHMFSIPIYKTRSFNKKRLNAKKDLLENCIFFICDEVSMVGERLMASVNMRLQQIFENEKLYGDRFVLLVGDLYQIDPVRQKPVYPKSELWTCCDFYELTTIIRQDDPNFIKALNNFRDSKMTDEDINLLRSREIQNVDEVPDSVIHLFYLNKCVDEFNEKKIKKSNENTETVNSIIDDDKKWDPTFLVVKIGIRYMITQNMDVGDGLANGTTGVVKGFDYDKNGGVAVIWMDFNSDTIGRKTKANYFKKHSRPGFENWVPIYKSTVECKLKNDPKVTRIFSNMFPMRAAEAITVHKSQGQTYHDGVCIHLTDNSYDKLRTDKSLQYVALTRVKRLEDLYIIGSFNFSVRNSNKFIRTENELNRLRTEKKLKLAYETFEDKVGDVIIHLNTGLTLNEHHQFISTDKWYGSGSLLIFTETNTIRSDVIEIPNFELVYRSDKVFRSGGGILCYKEASKSVTVVTSTRDDANKMYLTLLSYEQYLYIIIGVKGTLINDEFETVIRDNFSSFIRDERCIVFLGNFNMTPFTDFFNLLNLKKEISCEILTTNEEKLYDMVFTRNFDIDQDHIGCYEYIPSPNKPIYVKLPPRCELVKSRGDVYSAVYDSPGTSQQKVSEMEVDNI